MNVAHGQVRFRQIGLQHQSVLCSFPRLIDRLGTRIGVIPVNPRLQIRQLHVGQSKVRICSNRLLIKTGSNAGSLCRILRGSRIDLISEILSLQEKIISFRVLGWNICDPRRFVRQELGPQGICHVLGDLAFDRKDILDITIISLCPKMGVSLSLDQLHIDPHRATCSLDATFQNICHT